MKQTNKIYKDYRFLCKNRGFLILLILFVVLNIFDWSYTYEGTHQGYFLEANELFSKCINSEKNYLPVLVAKTSFTFLLVLVTYFIFKYYSRLFGYILISAINLFYLRTVILWIILLT